MADPPSYEESTASTIHSSSEHQKGDSKTPQPLWSIRAQVGLSRTQHVASIVSQIEGHIRDRAEQGLSKTTLVLIPSDQDAGREGTLVGLPDDEVPTMIQFEGRQNSTQFWTQDEALYDLRIQLIRAVSDGIPAESAREQPRETLPPPPPPRAKKSSWFGRKSSQATQLHVQPVPHAPASCPVTVDVQLDEASFRSETEYGLYETLRAKVVLATVEV